MKSWLTFFLVAAAVATFPGIVPAAAPRLVEPPAPTKDAPPDAYRDLPRIPSRPDFPPWEGDLRTAVTNWPPAESDPPIDVTHYDLAVTFDLAGGNVSGTATVTLVWGSAPGNTFHLDLLDLTATSVRKPGGPPIPFAQDATGLTVTVHPTPARGDTVTVAVDYGGHPSSGFYVYSSASYTFTEPEDSRRWFPCRDVPWDKATLTLHGTVPVGKILVGNGVLDSTSVNGSTATYHWRESHPLATYLMAAAISDYAVITPPSPVTPLAWYVYPGDVSAAQIAYQHVPDMVAFYDATLIPYPFDKYATCESNLGGGMEHQSATLMGSTITRGGLTYESISAHELAHQWFGDLVTTKGWAHVWLNEGFATFYDAVWHESFYGPGTFAGRMQDFEDNVDWWQANRTDHPVVDPPPDDLFSWIEYYKGAWVLRMLRDLVGKSVFDQAIVDYLTAHAYGNAETADLQAAMEARSGEDLGWFFDQWLYTGLGRPQLVYVPIFSPRPGGWLVQLDVTQVQTAPTIYRVPLEVRIHTVGGDTLVTGWVEQAHDVLAFPVSYQPTGVTVDPSNKLLGDVTEGNATAVEELRPPVLRAWPNPFRGALHLELPPAVRAGAVAIYDPAGRKVGAISLDGGDLRWDGRDLAGRPVAPGAYFLRIPGIAEAVRVVRLEGSTP